MAFDKVAGVSRIPTTVTALTVTLQYSLEDGATVPSAKYAFEVADQYGVPLAVRNGPLLPHLTAAQKTALANFMDGLWARASEVLP